MADDYRLKAKLSRIFTVLSYVGLLLLFAAWHFVLVPMTDVPLLGMLTFVLLKSSLLLAFAPTIIKGTPRGHAWLCFALMFYFIFAVLNAVSPATFIVGTAACILIGILFTSAMMYARWQSRYNKQLNGQ